MIHEKCGSCYLLADILPECISETFTIVSFVLHTELSDLVTHFCISGSEKIDTCFLFYGFEVVDLRPISREIEVVSLRCKGGTAIDGERDLSIEVLHESHPIIIVGICPIEFHIGEFLEVLRTRAFIAIGTPYLECLRKTSCHETFLPEFTDTDTHIDISIIVIVMRCKWTCLSSSSGMLDRRCIDFQESSLDHEVPCRRPEFCLTIEHCPKFIVHHHIEIALAVTLIVISDTMPLLWKRTDGFGEKCELFHEEGEFSLVRIEELSSHSDEVSEVDELFCKLVGRNCCKTFSNTRTIVTKSCIWQLFNRRKLGFYFTSCIDCTILSRKKDLNPACSITDCRKTDLSE